MQPKFDHNSNRFLTDTEKDNLPLCQRICHSPADVAALLFDYAAEEEKTLQYYEAQTTHLEPRFHTAQGTRVSTEAVVPGPNHIVIKGLKQHIIGLHKRANELLTAPQQTQTSTIDS